MSRRRHPTSCPHRVYVTTPSVRYRRNLPHIHPDGIPLFITFRLTDSLPAAVLASLKAKREQDLRRLTSRSAEERYRVEKKHFNDYDAWLDRCEHGPQWLKDPALAQTLCKKIRDLDGTHYQLFAYCVMPNHAHVTFKNLPTEVPSHRGKSAPYPATDAMRLIKGGTARDCNLLLKRNGPFWSHESYDHYIRNTEELKHVVNYILNNPLKAGLVNDWRDWPYTYASPELGEW